MRADRSQIHCKEYRRSIVTVIHSIWSAWTSVFIPAGGASALDPKWDDEVDEDKDQSKKTNNPKDDKDTQSHGVTAPPAGYTD